MVVVDDKKYACESCIKGHRSSSCAHADRPLFEVKKKGRPVSQCSKCRELRKTKRMHSKCQCSIEKTDKSNMKQLAGKSKRYIPILPALPNGLKGLGEGQASGSGLATLAKAAALCCSAEANTPSDPPPPPPQTSCCRAPSVSIPSKRPRPHSPSPSDIHDRSVRCPSLPPIQLPEPLSAPPVFPSIPPLSRVASLAGTGCTCGFDCTCPGCEEHRGPENVSKSASDCPECGHCVDSSHGHVLPAASAHGSSLPPLPPPHTTAAPPLSFLDAFFARAAALIPPPPAQRAHVSASSLDPQNVTVYPPSLFAGEHTRLDVHGPAFGLVRLPKLECCAGKCGCPGDSCGCGQDCNGCCSTERASSPSGQSVRTTPTADTVVDKQWTGCCASS